MFSFRLFVLTAALFGCIPLWGQQVAANNLDATQTLVLKSHAVFNSFMNDPDMMWFHENIDKAYGILVVPQMLRGGFIVGGSGGSGVLLARNRNQRDWSYPAFYTLGSLSVGLQVGADASELVLMIMTERGLNAMLSTELKLGADISVAAGPIGRNAKAQTADLLAFGRAKGIFGGVSLEGAILAPRNQWNRVYYGASVSPLDILIHQMVSNPQAEPLRRSMPQRRAFLPWQMQQPSTYQYAPVPSHQSPPPASREILPWQQQQREIFPWQQQPNTFLDSPPPSPYTPYQNDDFHYQQRQEYREWPKY
jgi:lipid-binding SYLF domain-containing protein